MSYYMTEMVSGKPQYFLVMENATLYSGEAIDYKQKVTKAEYNNYLQARDFISSLKEVTQCP